MSQDSPRSHVDFFVKVVKLFNRLNSDNVEMLRLFLQKIIQIVLVDLLSYYVVISF